MFNNALDDRIDQTLVTEVEFAQTVESQIGAERFHYHRNTDGNHGTRFYQPLMMSLIAAEYGLTYRPLRLK